MKLKKSLSLFCITFLGLAATALAGDGWMTDFEAAKAKAKAENKPMLLDFTGSDWCGWCIKLDEEVFGEAAFKEYASAELVLVEIDFPRGKEQSAELKAQNEKLAEQYGVRGFPTILVLSPEGKLIEQTGYQRGGPEAYVQHIKGILAK
jgi:protein disulfide-isomerase